MHFALFLKPNASNFISIELNWFEVQTPSLGKHLLVKFLL